MRMLFKAALWLTKYYKQWQFHWGEIPRRYLYLQYCKNTVTTVNWSTLFVQYNTLRYSKNYMPCNIPVKLIETF